jgi:GMP synthase-like glutamine amidotransferase
MKILCLKHIAFEGPAAIALWAQQRGYELQIENAFQNNPLPSPETFDMLLVMGGPMNAHEDAKYRWLDKEKSYIRSAIAAGKYVVGICLGAQLIAHVLGAKISKNEEKEIGWYTIERSSDCPERLALPETLRVLHWHGDTFALPKGAHSVAQSSACANQGFLFKDRVLALQCHLEITPESLALLIAACSNELVDAPFIQTAEAILTEPTETYEQMQAVLFQMLNALVAKE